VSKQPLITNMQRYSVNDGPGIRTNVFIKGCPLNCAWCHNPECKQAEVEIYWKRTLCQQCGLCLSVCPEDAIYPPIPVEEALESDTYHKIDHSKCTKCLKCVDVCPYGALSKVGDPLTIEQILKEVERDFPFYLNSGGGMTVTGGEPTSQPEFVTELLKEGKKKGLHICLDTSGYCPWVVLEGMLPYVDIFLYDLKHLDPVEHQRMTGVTNEVILENLKKLSLTGKDIRIRIPVIPEYNDSYEHIEKVAEFLKKLPRPVQGVDLLPYHNWCQEKYRWLGVKWDLEEVESLDPEEVEPLKEILEDSDIKATIGG
jgi:pyruvate formate lyase activating enzyme